MNKNLENIFSNIYKKSIWNNNKKDIPLSGPGSSLKNTKNIINFLDNFISNNKINSILDIGCGDLTWTSKTKYFNNLDISYTGIDIVDFLIEKNKSKYKNRIFINSNFKNLNIFKKYDLIILRDVIFHNYLDDILNLFKKIEGKFEFIAITSDSNKINTDIFNKIHHFSKRNIHIKPFNISLDYENKIYEPKFKRFFYIYNHNNFYDK